MNYISSNKKHSQHTKIHKQRQLTTPTYKQKAPIKWWVGGAGGKKHEPCEASAAVDSALDGGGGHELAALNPEQIVEGDQVVFDAGDRRERRGRQPR